MLQDLLSASMLGFHIKSCAARFLLLKWDRLDRRKKREGRKGGERMRGERGVNTLEGVLRLGYHAAIYCNPGTGKPVQEL